MYIFNPTFEKFDIQFFNRVYAFLPHDGAEVPDYPVDLKNPEKSRTIAQEVLERGRKKGLVALSENPFKFDFALSKEEIEKTRKEIVSSILSSSAGREGLKRYLEGDLKDRLDHYTFYKDGMGKAGKTVEDDYTFLKAQRWKREIIKAISYE